MWTGEVSDIAEINGDLGFLAVVYGSIVLRVALCIILNSLVTQDGMIFLPSIKLSSIVRCEGMLQNYKQSLKK
jgi:hypothetical protein